MWKIDRDYIAEPGEATRVGHSEEYERIPVYTAFAGITSGPLPITGDTVRFRLLDDDGEVYYGGWLHDDPEGRNQFAALSFGEGDAGATEIQVSRNGEWVTEVG